MNSSLRALLAVIVVASSNLAANPEGKDVIKKLVKYGNSYAIVIDRPIMELLSMKEGGTVKLKTDGSSLIITPVEIASPAELSKNTGHEQITAMGRQTMDAYLALANDQDHKELAKAMQEAQLKMATEMMPLQMKFQPQIMKLTQSDAYKDGLNEIIMKYPDNSSKEFQQATKELMVKLDPEVAAYYEQMEQISKQIMGEKLTAEYESYLKEYKAKHTDDAV